MQKNKLARFANIRALVVSLIVIVLFGQAIFTAHASLPFGKKDGAKNKTNVSIKNPIVEMDTNKGTIKIEIFADDAPITSKNFMDLVQRSFYNGLSFHRYVPGFCVQGGDPSGNGSGGFIDPASGQERTIPLEVTPKLKHSQAGMVAMARLSGDTHSASSQFYFTLGPASSLDGQYAVFGKVIEGLNIVRELRPGDKMTKVFILTKEHK